MIMGQGGGLFLVGLLLFALNVGQLYVLVGLVGLIGWCVNNCILRTEVVPDIRFLNRWEPPLDLCFQSR